MSGHTPNEAIDIRPSTPTGFERVERVRCPGHARHWFTVYGAPGLRAPKCKRCGAPNPRPLTAQEIHEHDDYVRAWRESFAGSNP